MPEMLATDLAEYLVRKVNAMIETGWFVDVMWFLWCVTRVGASRRPKPTPARPSVHHRRTTGRPLPRDAPPLGRRGAHGGGARRAPLVPLRRRPQGPCRSPPCPALPQSRVWLWLWLRRHDARTPTRTHVLTHSLPPRIESNPNPTHWADDPPALHRRRDGGLVLRDLGGAQERGGGHGQVERPGAGGDGAGVPEGHEMKRGGTTG